MKNKLAFLPIFFLLQTFNLWGQISPFAPIGARWYYRPHEFTYPESKLYTFTVTQDTMLDGVLAKELSCAQWANGQFQDFPELSKYVYTSFDSVFYYVDNQWVLLFNFGASIGDTIHSKVTHYDIPCGCAGPDPGEVWNIAYRVDSVAVEQIGGSPLRVQYVSSIVPNSSGGYWVIGKIVERIGAIGASYWWGHGPNCILSGFQGYLRCYEDKMVQYSSNIGNSPCDYVPTHEIDDHNFVISPNPSQGIFNFSFSPLPSHIDFSVIDGLGRTHSVGRLQAGDTSLELNLGSNSSGLFYVKFMFENKIKTVKIVKM